MTEDLEDKIQDKFKVDEKEILENKLDDVGGWFSFTENEIELSDKILELPNKWQYLTYLIAAKIAYYGNSRKSEEVTHNEANEFFGWTKGDGRTAKDYSVGVSNFITKTSGGSGRKIPPGKFKQVIKKIKEKLGENS